MDGLLIPALAGMAGANASALVLKNLNLGLLGNSVAGLIGGIAVSVLISRLDISAPATPVLFELLATAAGGALLMAAAGIACNRI